MEIRIILIDSNQRAVPYEFSTYQEAIHFLQSKLPNDQNDNVVEESPTISTISNTVTIPNTIPEGFLPENEDKSFFTKIKNIING